MTHPDTITLLHRQAYQMNAIFSLLAAKKVMTEVKLAEMKVKMAALLHVFNPESEDSIHAITNTSVRLTSGTFDTFGFELMLH